MSRIDDLLAERCPHGVRFQALGTLLERGGNIRWPDVYNQKFRYIDLTSVDRVTHSIGDTETITSENAPSRAQQIVREGDVLFGTTRPMLKRYCVVPAELDGQIASTGYCVLRPKKDRLLTNYLFHLIGAGEFYAFVEANERGASYPAIPDGVVKEYRIPVPPLDVQREIARILDHFTGLKAALEADLKAELRARQAQYAYYRDKMFAFHDIEVPFVPMGEVGDFIRGRRFTKNDVVDEGIPSMHYGEIYTAFGIATDQAVSQVREDLGPQLRYAKPGDVVIAAVGETVEDVGRGVAWLGTTDVAIHDDCFLYRSKVLDPKFVSYYLRTEAHNREKAKYVARAKVKRMSREGLAKLPIPVPPLKEQKRIVAILDELDNLLADLAVALPAEVVARRQQYDFYRDRLLTFEESSA